MKNREYEEHLMEQSTEHMCQEYDEFIESEKGNKMDYQVEIDNISEWMKDYSKKSGTKGYVVGLSGGIDSSVIACLAVQAVGKENVIGVSLPCQTRSDMNTDAKKLAEKLGIIYMNIPLEESFTSIDVAVSEALYPFPKTKFTSILSKANTKARLRMTALYEIANELNCLVAGTGNKSELDVGYFTKYGDGGVDMEPLGNYYKTEVYKMAELMPEIPNSVKIKAPSADLWEGQTDEDELGMTYKELDEILPKVCTKCDYWCAEYDELGIDKEKFKKVKNMKIKAKHKNETPPRYERY
jgi:NAD+ synthase